MSIADKLNYLITTKGLLKDNINKINNVLTDQSTFRSYPQELFNGYLDILNNGTDTLWNNLEKVSQTGTEAVLEGVETAPIKMVLNGNTSQDGTPTPDTPVEVKVVTGENVVSVSGKNKIDLTKHTNTLASNTTILNSNSYQCDLNGSWKGEIVVPIENLKPNTDYVISANVNSSATNSIISYIRGYNGSDYTELVKDIYFYWFKNGKKFNSGEYERYVLKLFITGFSSRTGIEKLEDLQIEEGTAKTDFVPFSKTDYPLSLGTLELCKIGTYQDYLYKNNGKWYVHKEIEKTIYNGAEAWNSYNNQAGNFTVRVRNTLIKSGFSTVMLCNYFRNTLNGDRANKGEVSNTGQYYNLNFVPTDDLSITNVIEWKTWLSSNNVSVYYPLATPTETEITDTTLIEQLEAISKAKSVKDKTYITQTNDELPFILDIEAIKEYEVN